MLKHEIDFCHIGVQKVSFKTGFKELGGRKVMMSCNFPLGQTCPKGGGQHLQAMPGKAIF